METIRIYKIVSTALNKDWCYVGKTSLNLKDRWIGHKSDFKAWLRTSGKETKIAWFDFAIEINDLQLKTFDIKLLEEVQVSSKREIALLERKWILELKSCNVYVPKSIQPDDPETLKIYKIITSLDTNFCYVGHTLKTIKQRWKKHIESFKKWVKSNQMTRKYAWFTKATEIEDLELKTFTIELLEETKVKTKDEIKKLERKWIEELNSCNIMIPGRTSKEWENENKDKMKSYYKKYRDKPESKEIKKKWIEENKVKTKEYMKKYQEENKEKLREQKKEYEEENKEKLKEKHNCSCGGTYTYNNRKTHEKSKKHQNFIQSQVQP